MDYPLTFYTNRFIPANAAACVWQRVLFVPIILIRPEYRDDYGIYRHELQHVKQAFKGLLFIHALLYAFDWLYRFDSEVEAYQEQLRANKEVNFRGGYDYTEMYAEFIATSYSLPVSQRQAYTALTTNGEQ